MKKLILLLGVVSVLGGCKKSFLDVNENPNSPGNTRADFAFTGAVITTAENMVGPSQLGGAWTGGLAFSTSFTGGGQQKTYVFSNANFNFWDNSFDNITDYNYVVENAVKDGYPHLVGPAIVMRSYQYQKLVDLYNNIPYQEAFNVTTNVTPSYTSGQAVYEDLIKKLDSAITLMKAATFPATAPEDIVFRGNQTSWIQLANTLKLRMLIRQSLMPGREGYITSEINKIAAEGTGFLVANAQIRPPYLKETGKLNPFYGGAAGMGYNENDVELTNHRFYKVGSFLIDYLKATNDTFRLQRKADMKVAGNNGNKNDFSNYTGVNLGQRSGASETVVSSIGSSLIVRGEATRPVVFMTAAESYFLQAEAGVRYGLLGDPKTNYESGVIEAFKLDAGIGTSPNPTASVDVATAAAMRYLANGGNNVSYTASSNKLQAIAMQKWIALSNFDGLEAWSEWRRTGYPPVPLSDQASVGVTQPRRLYYPLSEQNTNLENYNKQGVINVYTGRVFWDVR